MKNILYDLMFYKSLPYDSLLKMDTESLKELLNHIKELMNPDRGTRLTEQQKEMIEESKNTKW